MRYIVFQLMLLIAMVAMVTSECEDGTCKETRDMDLGEEEHVADRYLRRSNDLLARFSKDLTSEKRIKKSEGSVNSLGDEIRELEELVRRSLKTQSELQVERIRMELLTRTQVLCSELDIKGPNADECSASQLYRNLDGSCNNLIHPSWGKASYPLNRVLNADYDDGVSEFCARVNNGNSGRNDVLPTAREVSLAITGTELVFNPTRPSQLVMHFGQFIDHDIVHVPTENAECKKCVKTDVCCPIGVPKDDPVFSDFRCLQFRRSRPFLDSSCNVQSRNQENQITSYLDSSNVYGSNDEDGNELRDQTKGTGQMKVNEEPIDLAHLPVLPPDLTNDECTVGAKIDHCGKGGDLRAAEQPGLTGIHTLLVREHNRIANELSKLNVDWTDDRLYQEAKRIVNGIYQHIIYNEWLPIILGYKLVEISEVGVGDHYPYPGYDVTNDATVTNVFATSAFRFGHSFVPPHLKRVNSKFESYPAIPLREAFFNGTHVLDFDNGGVDSILLGMVDEDLLKIDRHFSEDILAFLFAGEGASFGMDLIALNIQRGRDHGLPSYAEFFNFCHNHELNHFSDMSYTSNDDIERLTSVYDHVQDIDPFIGMVTEEPMEGAVVGPTAGCIISRQFSDLRYGDRFWYENPVGAQAFNDNQLNEIRQSSYASLLCDDLNNTDTVQPYAFMMPKNHSPTNYDSFVEFSRSEKYPLEDGRLPGLDNRRVSCSDILAIPKINLDFWREN